MASFQFGNTSKIWRSSSRSSTWGKVHLLGHSRGGAVALNLAKQHPELVRTLILADTSGAENLLPDTPESQRIVREGENLRASMGKALPAGDFEGAGALLLDSVNDPGAWAQMPPERRQRVLDNIVTGSVVDERPPTTCDQVKQFDFPVLYVTGERSPKRYAAMFEALRQCKASPKPVIILGAAHECPECARFQLRRSGVPGREVVDGDVEVVNLQLILAIRSV